jgi:hypothetical protein
MTSASTPRCSPTRRPPPTTNGPHSRHRFPSTAAPSVSSLLTGRLQPSPGPPPPPGASPECRAPLRPPRRCPQLPLRATTIVSPLLHLRRHGQPDSGEHSLLRAPKLTPLYTGVLLDHLRHWLPLPASRIWPAPPSRHGSPVLLVHVGCQPKWVAQCWWAWPIVARVKCGPSDFPFGFSLNEFKFVQSL